MRSVLKFCLLFVAPFLMTVSASAGDETGLEDFLGEWVSSGNAFGQPARSHMIWSEQLSGKFYRIDYAIKTGAPEFATPMFQGVGHYRPSESGQFKAYWADSSGDLHPIKATLSENTLTSLWGVAGEKLGRTEYKLVDPDTLDVTDWIMKDYEWTQFNQNRFTKVPSK